MPPRLGMADDARDKDDLGSRQTDEAALSARLRRLGERLGDVVPPPDTGPAPRSAADPSALGRGIRLSTEFVVGVLAGAGLGWLCDRWLGTSPWGLIVMLLLGFAASIINLVRSAGAGDGTAGSS